MNEVKAVRRGTLKIECFDADCEAWWTNATLYWLEPEEQEGE